MKRVLHHATSRWMTEAELRDVVFEIQGVAKPIQGMPKQLGLAAKYVLLMFQSCRAVAAAIDVPIAWIV